MLLTPEMKSAFQVDAHWAIGMALTPRWGDIDGFGHVNHIAYLQWCEEARNDYFKVCGIKNFQMDRPGPVVRKIDFDYRRPLSHGDDVLITSRVAWLKRSSFLMEFSIWSGGLIGTGAALCIWYLNSCQKAVELDESLRQKICAFDKAEDRQLSLHVAG